ncbi:MAG TPA: LacI family DNA-binding transcriptional regulator [Terriglobales bacterium]|jgi:DNA-binding LacI/PurR family transcriptional regulator|nr:LacI family DNA-binding transcriptional regulator [Terriglobales bacterium]
MKKSKQRSSLSNGTISLQELAQHVGLTKGTVSAVLNDSPSAKTIPQHTKERIFAAARELNYRPNFFARTLRSKRTFTIGVVTEEIGDAYGGMVISGIEAFLSQHKYFFLTVAHRHDPHWLQQYLGILLARGVEGLITVDTTLKEILPIPAVAVAGHRRVKGVTNIVLDHDRAAHLALHHLFELGHRDIAFLRGQTFSSDSKDRWQSICDVAQKLKLRIRTELAPQLESGEPSPQEGYQLVKNLLSQGRKFTALFAYNDISAIGAIRAIREAGLRVPEDISVVGFDDIRDAAYHLPSITTVRQPLRKMGEIAAQTLVERVEGRKEYPDQIATEPSLIVRESTAKARPPVG